MYQAATVAVMTHIKLVYGDINRAEMLHELGLHHTPNKQHWIH